MHANEIEKLTELEDSHWWYAERRSILRRMIQGLPASKALDIGAAGGGNTRILTAAGWDSTALEYSETGAAVAHNRGLTVVRADATKLPFRSRSLGLVVAFDVLEHVEAHGLMASEIERVLVSGGTALVAVPADMRLWSAHDEAVGHVRRYTRADLGQLLDEAGLILDELWSWNVLMRPIAAVRRRRSTGSDLERVNPLLNRALRGVIAAERYLPVKALPGVSLVARVHSAC